MKNASLWRVATVAFAAGSILYTSLSSRRSRQKKTVEKLLSLKTGFNVPVEYQKVFDKNLIIPAGWAFGVVWSTIYSGLGALLVHQALPAQADNPRYQKAQPWLLVNFALNAIFGRFFNDDHKSSVVISDLTTKANLAAALALHQSLEIGKTDVSAPEKYLRIPVSLYAGWLTTATVVGTPDTLLTLGWEVDQKRDVPLAAGILSATAGAGYVLARQLNDPWYLVPFVAGFGGIATRQVNRNPVVGWTAAGLAAAYVGILAYWLPKGKFHDYERTVEDTEAVEIEPVAVADAGSISSADVYSGLQHQTDIARGRMDPIEAEGLD